MLILLVEDEADLAELTIDFLATIDIEHKATTYFKFFIKVAGRETPLKVEFNKKLYQDGRDG